jgi:lysozyme family protein
MINKYNEFLIEREFQIIVESIIRVVESEGVWTSDNTIEWDLTNNLNNKNNKITDKLYIFLSKLPKEDIRKYFYKLVDKLEYLPKKVKKNLIINYAAIFLSFVSTGYLLESPVNVEKLDNEIKTEIVNNYKEILSREMEIPIREIKKAKFELAQDIVKQVEACYSSDKVDTGIWIKVKGGKRFIGTNHGISAPILAEYLGRTPTKEDMINLSYDEALEIYKSKYWDAQNLGEFHDQIVANIIYDGCVNQGISGMKSVIRRSLIENGINISESDNPFSIEWIKKINQLDQAELFKSIKKNREERYKTAKTFKRHGKGWLNRLNEFEYTNA